MKITFVDNLLIERHGGAVTSDLQPHLGLISLAALCEAAGHDVSIYDPKRELSLGKLLLDPSLYKKMADAIWDTAPDIVGFTTLGCSFLCAVKVAGRMKQCHPELPILFGGPHATILHQEIVERFSQVDVVVRHEAELTLLPLLEELKDGGLRSTGLSMIPGITFRTPEGQVSSTLPADIVSDLDLLPFPSFHHYLSNGCGYDRIRVEAGRGCPFECTFCSTASFFGRKYRLKSPQRIGQELDYLATSFGVHNFSLTHDLFTVNRRKVIAFCEHARGRGYTWSCSARMDCVDEELIYAMYDAGCRGIYFGIETGSARMQSVTQKRQNLELVLPTLDYVRRAGISITTSFITGYPEEQDADQAATLDMMGSILSRCDEGIELQLHLLTPEPGTALIDQWRGSLRYDGYVTDQNFPTLSVDDDVMLESNADIFPNHHYYESTVLRSQHIFVTSAVESLQCLGPVVIAYLMRETANSFAHLVHELLLWNLQQPAVKQTCDDELLVRYALDVWGATDPKSSLVKYMVAVNRASSRKESNSITASDKTFQLADNVEVLRNSHDCGQLLEVLVRNTSPKVRNNAVVDPQLSDWAVVVSAERMARNVHLNSACAEFLQFCRTPRTFDDLKQFAKQYYLAIDDLHNSCIELRNAGLLASRS